MTSLAARIASRIRREGPISFAAYMDAALYDPDGGFFAEGHGAGRAGRDFVTSPEVGPLFGMLVARAVDRVWTRMGEPDPFVVVEVGAGTGRLAAEVLRAGPACAPALRYVLVERSPVLRVRQRELVALEPADEVLGAFVTSGDPDEPVEAVTGAGPIACALDDLPAVGVVGVVLANELLDNLAVCVVERAHDSWLEVRVGVDADGGLIEVLVPAAPELVHEADALASGTTVDPGDRLPVVRAAAEWLERVARMLRHGDIVLVDYMDDVGGLVARGPASWLRTYRAHERGSAVLADPGAQDITSDVLVEAVHASARAAGLAVVEDLPQRAWLEVLGIDALVDEGRAVWRERAHLGDLAAIAGRSRVGEAAALTDPAGLGAHRVIVLRK